MKKRIKTRISQLALIAALVLTFGVPVYAAVEDTNEAIARGSTQYIDFNVSVYNGITTYSDSRQNTSNSAYVNVTRSSLAFVETGIFDYNNRYMINGMYSIDVPSGINISPAHQYPGQYICAGFYRIGITGDNYVAGRYYYNGL